MNIERLPIPILLLSLPRSGSTLLQRMLAAHPDIETSTEPNVLFYPLISLESEGIYSIVDHLYFSSALNEFIARLPRGRSDYDRELGLFARRLYAQFADSPARYFIDKSPFYCFVAPRIFGLFENAKYVFLWRHPLAAAASMLRFPGANPQQWSLYKFPHTHIGLASLIEAYRANEDKAISVRYEDLVRTPKPVLSRVFDYLDLPDQANVDREFSKVQFSGKHYDPHADLSDFQKVRTDRVDEWRKVFANPLRKRWARQYLEWIGEERLSIMGYSLDEILSDLSSIPTQWELIASDAYWMSFGFFFRLLNGRIVLNNMRKWRKGEQFWGYW